MMLTRCPACDTTFRIRPEQAKARQGKVRCGRCKHVFNAIEFLVDDSVLGAEPKAAAAATPSAKPIAEPIAEPVAKSVAKPVAEPVAERAPKPAPQPKGAARILAAYATNDNDSLDDFSVLGDVAPTVRGKSRKEPVIAPSPLSDDYSERGWEQEKEYRLRGPIRWPWALGGLIAVLALAGQIAIAWRVDIATRYPELREPLDMLCEPLGCTVGLPLNASLLKIESSDLHPSPQKKGRLELKGILKNHAPYAQTWPNLELTITDGSDRTLARRILTPELFVSPPEILATGFPAMDEFAVQVQIDVGDLPASGYRLYLFYP